jgi:hypothetical protein
MRHPMDNDEVLAFLTSEPARAAKLATVRPDGRPHVAPVWFVLDRRSANGGSPLGDIVITTGANSVKGRDLQHDQRVAICVDDDFAPFSFVTLEGVCSLSDDPSELYRWAAAAGARYLGSDLADEIGRRNGGPGGLVVRVRPTNVVAIANLAEG